jgi:hypothetical protein
MATSPLTSATTFLSFLLSSPLDAVGFDRKKQQRGAVNLWFSEQKTRRGFGLSRGAQAKSELKIQKYPLAAQPPPEADKFMLSIAVLLMENVSLF